MPSLSQSLAQSLAQPLGISLSAPRLPFSALSFANASPRYAINPVTGAVTGPFAAGVPATIMIGGRRYLQNEASVQSLAWHSQDAPSETSIVGITLSKTSSPVGDNTADLLMETATTSEHRASSTPAAIASGFRSLRMFYKPLPNVRNLGVDNAYAPHVYDPATGVWIVTAGDTTYSARISASGWHIIGMYYTGGYFWKKTYLCSGTDKTYTGDITYGGIVWQREVQEYPYITSPILTTGAAVIRAKDQAYYPAAAIPAALREHMTRYFYLEYSSAQLALCVAGSKRYLWRFVGGTGDTIGCYILSTDRKIYVEVNGADVDATAIACTWSANQQIRTALNRAAGTVAITGLTTGNEVLSFAAPAVSAGDLILDMNDDGTHTVMDSQLDGIGSEPEIGV